MGKLKNLINRIKSRLEIQKKRFDYIANDEYKKRTGHDIKEDFDGYKGGD